jgi:carnitine O-palmitoyltransferase 1
MNRDAMCGKGADRHLFGLFVLSMGLKIDSPFLKRALSRPWKLSTSQQPQQQDPGRWKALKNAGVDCKSLLSPGGGFGPVADDGYGVSYMLAGDDSVYFHISAKAAAPDADGAKFKKHLFTAFDDMHKLFQ